MDTEKLLATQKKLSKNNIEAHSDAIGVDQRMLRLRYGQFLGEESEGDQQSGKLTDINDSKSPQHADASTHDAPSKQNNRHVDDANQAILAEYGHMHDIAEAATLLDPQTKALLRAALNEMWQAELHLRQTQPAKALPYEYRALGFIKKVQQADRIYLARVGNALPVIDDTRRLTGDRAGLASREDWLTAAIQPDAALFAFWQALDHADSVSPDYTALHTWLNNRPVPPTLDLMAALDDYQRKPDCMPCLQALKAQLWPLLTIPMAEPLQRVTPNKMGQRYLDALHREQPR
jgi:hypothetical protein